MRASSEDSKAQQEKHVQRLTSWYRSNSKTACGWLGMSLMLLLFLWIGQAYFVSLNQIHDSKTQAKNILIHLSDRLAKPTVGSLSEESYRKTIDEDRVGMERILTQFDAELLLHNNQFLVIGIASLFLAGYLGALSVGKTKSNADQTDDPMNEKELEEISAQAQLINMRKASDTHFLKSPLLFDSLTKLISRNGFDWAFQQAFLRAKNMDTGLTLALVDIDRFKKFNEDEGYDRGNHVLQSIADILTEGLREYDVVARYYGDAFAVILFDEPAEAALRVMEEIRKTIEVRFKRQITVSMGLCALNTTVDSQHEMHSRASQAQMTVKNLGGDGAKVF